ncbi:hypothetical protein BDW74DRAFT_18610 [Aspergillus multicolor]|uniref:fungal specific transcription factor domain-containing protein n=1 Tax=Aspergillus multicolor TaxID=41759 RepID=UPI003CCD5A11
MAVALGMHRKIGASTASGSSNDPSMLKRIWWTLAVRDAHCSALLGRPFRINMFQCDTDMLTVEDFADDHDSSSHSCRESFEYQIHVAKLCLILRKIVYFRFGPAAEGCTVDLLQGELSAWQAQLPAALQFLPGQTPPSNAAVHLDLLFHYHTMLLHMDQPCQPRAPPTPDQPSPPVSFLGSGLQDSGSAVATGTSAHITSSSAIKLMTRTSLLGVPHEVFPGFFVAGIILYQQAQQAQNHSGSPTLARMLRASFDNCQMLLAQSQNTWDPGVWALKVLEFLSANATTNPGGNAGDTGIVLDSSHQGSAARVVHGEVGLEYGNANGNRSGLAAPQAHAPGEPLTEESTWTVGSAREAGVDYDRGLGIDLSDYMLLPNFFPTPFTG